MRTREEPIRRMMAARGLTNADIARAGGRFVDGWYEIPDANHKEMMRGTSAVFKGATQPAPDIEEPSVAELAANFAGAVVRWVQAGAPVVDEATYLSRAALCDACQHWNASARLGLGKCSAPGCGCTRFKRFLATERCPLRKW